MKKRLFVLLILLVLVMSLAIPAGAASAGGANRIPFTAVSYSGCVNGDPGVDFCSGGDPQPLPNGQIRLVGVRDTMIFSATDDRWNTKCLFSADPFIVGKNASWPLMGSFYCTPRDAKFAGGYWVGTISQVIQNDQFMAVWHAKGYGTFDGLLVTTYNSYSRNFKELQPGPTDAGVITELPGYNPVK